MNYQEALTYFDQIPPFVPRETAPGEDLFNLDMITRLLSELGNPEKHLRFIHVAGTNAKGSTCAYLLSILTKAGLKTGLFTSPMLETFADQFRIGNQLISEDDIGRYLTIVKEASERIELSEKCSPSGFEQLTAMAFLYFKAEQCDVVILETGLGGRLDATNVIPAPMLSIITPISLEHTQVLGDTLAKIAFEKAGIIKNGSRAVLSSPQEDEVRNVLMKKAEECGVPYVEAVLPDRAETADLTGQTFYLPPMQAACGGAAPAPSAACGSSAPDSSAIRADSGEELLLRTVLLGSYQIRNAALAADAAIVLRSFGFEISDTAIREGISETKWPGRFELLLSHPYVIVDGSHNPQGAETLYESLTRLFPGKKILFITGVLADKRYDQMIASVLPLAKCFYTITPMSPRALPAEELAEYIRGVSGEAFSCSSMKEAAACASMGEVIACASMEEAIARAMKQASPDDCICAFGSLYSVGVLRSVLSER